MKNTREISNRRICKLKELDKQRFMSKTELKKAVGGAYAVTSDDLTSIKNRKAKV